MAEKIHFEWDSNLAEEGVDYYQLLERAPGAAELVLAVDNIVGTNFDVLMTSLVTGTYGYAVRAVNEFGAGAQSAELTVNFILPSQVEGFRFTLV